MWVPSCSPSDVTAPREGEKCLLGDPFVVLEEIRWNLLSANDCLPHDWWGRLEQLGQALDLVEELRDLVEQEIRDTVVQLRLWGQESDPEIEEAA